MFRDAFTLPNLHRSSIYGVVALVALGVLFVVGFKHTIAMSDPPTNVNSANYASDFRKYNNRIEFYRAMVDTGQAMLDAALPLGLGAIALTFALRGTTGSPAPTASLAAPVVRAASVVTPAPARTRDTEPSGSPPSTRDILKKLKG